MSAGRELRVRGGEEKQKHHSARTRIKTGTGPGALEASTPEPWQGYSVRPSPEWAPPEERRGQFKDAGMLGGSGLPQKEKVERNEWLGTAKIKFANKNRSNLLF